MASYQLQIKRTVYKELGKLTPESGRRLLSSIETLATNPRPTQSHKLKGSENSYRLRVGDYRVVYQVDDPERTVTVTRVGHRREVYR